MKKLLIIMLLAISVTLQAQQVDDANWQSRVKVPQGYQFSPLGTQSTTYTVNGFDNFWLGTDFGEPYIATNPKDPLNSVCAYNINNFYYTLDGVNWIKGYPNFPGYSVIGDPVVTYDSLGNVYYLQMYQNGSEYGAAVGKSTDKGVTWSMFSRAYSSTAGLGDKPWITAVQSGGPYSNYLFVGWRQFGSTGMRVVRSTDGGQTWSSPITLSGDQGAYVAAGPNGNIPGGYIYFACTSGGSIILYRSSDGGLTWSYVSTPSSMAGPGVICYGRYTVKNCIRTDNFPRMAVDNSWTSTRGTVYIAFAANPAGPDNADIFVVKSTNYGLNWSSAIRVNDDATTTDQWMPAITVDSRTGRVYVFWYDSRNDPSGNLLTEMWCGTSTNGGNTFINNKVSDVQFNPNNMAVGQGQNQANYIGDYIGNSSIGKTAINVWTDARFNNMGSFVAYSPDFAMLANPNSAFLHSGNDSATFTIKVPAIRGPFDDNVRFTSTLDTLPTSGSIILNFINGKDSITTFPDSVYLKAKIQGSVPPKAYYVTVTGRGTMGAPVHKRSIILYVGVNTLTIGTNREGVCEYKVNGTQFNTKQTLVFVTGSNVTVQALSPKVVGGTQYVFQNWSDNGDTTHTITVNNNISLTAFYKIQFKLIMNSSIGNTFGGNVFYDSATAFTFGVTGRFVNYNNQTYQFRGWTGSGVGSYTSPDSSGFDTVVTRPNGIINPIVQTARWLQVTSVQNISTEIPKEYKLYQNFPNPFNPVTTIEFDIVKTQDVKLQVYDILGREIRTLIETNLGAGKYRVQFNAVDLPSGIYFYKLTTPDYTNIKRMILMK
jgi:hypothetical protein